MNRKKFFILLGVGAVGFSMLACEPVFAIGWEELLTVFVVFVILLGWPLLKVIQARMNAQKKKQNNKK